MIKLSEIKQLDKVVTQKNHPCGNNVWTVLQKGVDFKIQCDKCGHTVIISAENLKKSIKSILEQN